MSRTSKNFKLCHLSELKEKTGKRFIVNETDIAVFKVNGEVYAVSNICPHQKSALIYEGLIEGCNVICPLHGWRFNLKNGNKPDGGNGLKIYKVKIENNIVLAEVNPPELKW